MPITASFLAGAIAAGLASTGHLGISVPQLSLGVATGVFLYLSTGVKPISIDVGAVGTGVGTIPLIVPAPLILSSLTAGFVAQSIFGPFAPATISGLTIGLSTGFATGLIVTTHAGVGVGTGVVTIKGSSAVPFMLAGFASAGLSGLGAIKKATAIGIGLDICFAAYTTATPIAGGAGPLPSTGVGVGLIV